MAVSFGPRLIAVLLPLLILGVGFGTFRYLKETRPEPAPVEIRERIWRVETELLTPQPLAPMLELFGRVETPDLWRVAASSSAHVARVSVREGEQVAAGNWLVELDPRDLTPRLAQAAARVEELDAELESARNRHATDQAALAEELKLLTIAESGVARAQRLAKQRVGSETDLDTAEQELARQALAVSNRRMSLADFPARERALLARRDSARAALEEIALAFERSRVRAPFAGIVAQVAVTAGDQVKPDEVLLNLYPLDTLEVRARLPAPLHDEIAGALRAGVPLHARAEGAGRAHDLVLLRLAGEAGPSGVDALFGIAGDRSPFLVGQLLRVLLERPQRHAAVPVPFSAVYGGDRIYRLVDGRMRGSRVETLGSWFAEDGEERLLVEAPDLAPGDRLVVTHMPNAVEGLRVESLP